MSGHACFPRLVLVVCGIVLWREGGEASANNRRGPEQTAWETRAYQYFHQGFTGWPKMFRSLSSLLQCGQVPVVTRSPSNCGKSAFASESQAMPRPKTRTKFVWGNWPGEGGVGTAFP